MKNLKFFAIIIILLSTLFFSTCGELMTDGKYKSFDRKLRGTWVSNDPGLYSGTLKITSDTITIDGYGEDKTSLLGDDSKRPFKDFPRRKDITGYSEIVSVKENSEEGTIFIMYGETAENGIPYIYTQGGKYPNEFKLLEFTFGGRKEILESTMNY
jgi:hypothetical protein